jgi:hypothetical protein
MTDRARLSKRPSYTSQNGATFLHSADFPSALISTLQKSDPKGLLFGASEIPSNPTPTEQSRLRPLLDSSIKGKRILVCSGGDDKLVPYHCSKPFLDFLKDATAGWYKDEGVYLEDVVYEGVGHAYSGGMVRDALKFLSDTVAGKPSAKI